LFFSFCVLALVSLILVLFFSFLRGKRVKKNKQKKAKTKKKKKTKAIRTLNIVFLKKRKICFVNFNRCKALLAMQNMVVWCQKLKTNKILLQSKTFNGYTNKTKSI